MEVRTLDTRGLKCPQPMLKLAVQAPQMKKGEKLKVLGDCPTFEYDLRIWCERLGKTIIKVEQSANYAVTVTIAF